MGRKRKRREAWKITKERPLRIGGSVVLTSREATLTIISPHKIRRLRKSDIDSAPAESVD